jgi:localization factor PodJL
VHGTLGELAQRLAAIEQSIRNEARAPAPAHADLAEDEPLELTHPVGKVAVRLVEDAPAMSAFDHMLPPRAVRPAEPEPIAPEVVAPPVQPAPMAEPEPVKAEEAEPQYSSLPPAPQLDVQHDVLRAQAAALVSAPPPHAPRTQLPQSWSADASVPKRIPPNGPLNPDLPPDEPLEPGSGRPPMRANPAARIAASEAALGHARPAQEAPAGGKSSFIAAARRAAQAAMQQEPAAPTPDPEAESTDTQPARGRVMRRVKSLFVAASIVAIVVGSVQFATNMLNLGRSSAPSRTTQEHVSMDRRADTTPGAAAPRHVEHAASPTAAAQLPSPMVATPLALVPPNATIDLLAPPGHTANIATKPTPQARPAPQAAAANGASATDITGSIPKIALDRSAPKPAAAPLDSTGLPTGIGGPRLRQAAAAGNVAAAYEVAMRFAEGHGVPTNLTEAARWYQKAADKGLAPAQFRLASLFEKGQGVKKDLARARTLYFAAARQGHAKAMHNLAVLYAEGVDGKPDYATAVQWFREAAQHGVSDSQYNLGILYARGIGVEKNLPESYKWFALAAKHGDKEAAKKRDEVARHLDAKALATARRAVAKFVPTPQPHQATSVPPPPGGWDKAAATSAAPTARTVNHFVVGKR